MSDRTHISWADATWNPVTGCTRVSEGCDHCYIERTPPFRMAGRRFDKLGTGGSTGVTLHPDRLDQPLQWRKPRRVFVCSLADLFHDDVPDEFIAQVWAVMACAQRHVFQVLTKRPTRMRSLMSSVEFQQAVRRLRRLRRDPTGPWDTWPLLNVWCGVSVENQQWADIRIPILLNIPAAVRWVSAEPLLGPVELWCHLWQEPCPAGCGCREPNAADIRECACDGPCCTDEWNPKPALDWLVVGGESGPGARPMHPDWARSLRDECQAANVAFHFKQWGEWAPNGARGIGAIERISNGRERLVGEPIDSMGHRLIVERMGKRRAGRLLDGRTWDAYPASAAPSVVMPR